MKGKKLEFADFGHATPCTCELLPVLSVFAFSDFDQTTEQEEDEGGKSGRREKGKVGNMFTKTGKRENGMKQWLKHVEEKIQKR